MKKFLKNPIECREYILQLEGELKQARLFDYIYWEFNKDILPNVFEQEVVNTSNHFYDLLEWGYVYKCVMAIRKMTDGNKGKEVRSLRKLLGQFQNKATKNYKREISNDIFLLKQIRDHPDGLGKYADNVLAHLTTVEEKNRFYTQVRDCLQLLWQMLKKYVKLYDGSILEDSLSIDADWKSIFQYPWISR